jgi:hypothetical protein
VNNIGTTLTQNLPNLVTPFTSPSKVAVGLENPDSKDVAVPPIEQSAESAVPLNRRSRSEKNTSSAESANDPFAENPESENSEQDEAEELEKQAVIRQLAARDQDVRQHEAAHSAVGSALAGAPQFNYVRGPDGVLYAESGEVSISLRVASDDPQVVLSVAEQVQRAALAPAEPIAQQARSELAAQRVAESKNEEKPEDETASVGDQQTEEKISSEQEKAARLEAQAEEIREKEARQKARREEALREQARSEANAKRLAEINNPPVIPVKDLAQRLLGLSKIEQDVKVGAVLDQRV